MLVPIVTKYDGRGAKYAKKDIGALGKTATYAKVGVAALAASVVALGKAGVKAALADAKGQSILAKQLGNMGYGSATGAVTEYISKMQLATNVSEDELRPAMAKALRATDDLTASQQLLALSADVAYGANKDFGTVVSALTKAIAGNRKGLISLDTGMSKTYITSAKMSDIVGQLEKKFGGSAKSAVKSWGGQWENLNITLDEAKETIGVGIVQAFATLASEGGMSMDGLTKKVNNFADTTANVFVGLAALSKEAQGTDVGSWFKGALEGGKIGTLLKLLGLGTAAIAAKGRLAKKLAEEQARETDRENRRGGALNKTNGKALTTLKKVADAKSKVTAATKKSNTASAKELQLKILNAKYDLNLIGLAAAKKRTGSTDTMNRLNDLTAIALDNAGVTAAQAGASTSSTVTNNFITTVQGSVVTQQELTSILAQELALAQQRNGYGKWGGGL